MAKTARVLMTAVVDGVVYQPDQVIESSAAKIKALGNAVDSSPEAVEYCTNVLGKEVIKIGEAEESPPDNSNQGGGEGSSGQTEPAE